jgi:hypothetical protein
MKQWAAEKFPHLNPAVEMEAMLDWHRSHGNRYTDWVATWRTWMRKAKPAEIPEISSQRVRRSEMDRMWG